MSLSAAEVDAFIAQGLPAYRQSGLSIESASDTEVVVRQRYSADQLRPGGTLSGPTMMTLADTAMFALVLARMGPVAMAVTQQLTINFLNKPAPSDLMATATFLKLGRSLAVMSVDLHQADSHRVAFATGTYALPSARVSP